MIILKKALKTPSHDSVPSNSSIAFISIAQDLVSLSTGQSLLAFMNVCPNLSWLSFHPSLVVLSCVPSSLSPLPPAHWPLLTPTDRSGSFQEDLSTGGGSINFARGSLGASPGSAASQLCTWSTSLPPLCLDFVICKIVRIIVLNRLSKNHYYYFLNVLL